MARVLVLGAGVSGHTAALYLKKRLGKAHEVVVVSPNSQYNWIPSNIWVGVGLMTPTDVTFPLAPLYARHGITFKQARAVEVHPEGRLDALEARPTPDIAALEARIEDVSAGLDAVQSDAAGLGVSSLCR